MPLPCEATCSLRTDTRPGKKLTWHCSKTIKPLGLRPRGFTCFLAFGNLLKPSHSFLKYYFTNWSFRTFLFQISICKWNSLFHNWAFRTVLFLTVSPSSFLWMRNTLFPNWLFGNRLRILFLIFFSKSLIIHQDLTKEIMTVTVFGNLILISRDFYDFISFPS